jgi:hypothetical protein
MLVGLVFAWKKEAVEEMVREIQVRDEDRIANSPEVVRILDGSP